MTRDGATSLGLYRLLVADDANGDVVNVLKLDRSFRRSERLHVNVGLSTVFELNRYFDRDAMNWRLEFAATWSLASRAAPPGER